ncbi:hypothetical protein [Roseisolibacter agri]|uniref:Uncharacterized protein n=1 Tax=Roseisolibacter agri TaxID=2014610 RepID=A0AA37V2G1_9BACT|nr:hypothetical protein [Roseisolibacter agri]GLC27760.1 hypothetical protein rosag_42730 [Roseisolibacter agri]
MEQPGNDAGRRHVTAPVQGAPTPHLLTVWDPLRLPDSMEATARHLLALAQAHAAGEGADHDEDDVYVWWGKMRSPHRQQPLPHLAEILAVDDHLRAAAGVTSPGDHEVSLAPDREVQLYLTDYRSLYVAHVGEVTQDDPRLHPGERAHLPAGVYTDEVHCDCWFLLFDIRRVVLDDTRAVVAELRKLRNTRYAGRPVSLYGGMVELPLLVTRDDGARWFDHSTRLRLTEGRPWVEFDAELSGVGAVAASLRDDVLGEATWLALDPAARQFVATAEKIFRDHRADPAFDFSPVIVNLAKAYEVHLGLAFGAVAHRFSPSARRVNMDGRPVDVFERQAPSLGALGKALGENLDLRAAVSRHVANAAWVTTSLPPILRQLSEARNPAAHSEPVTREDARRLRDAQLGVGSAAMLDELARVRALTG